jgi:hypothetical protein
MDRAYAIRLLTALYLQPEWTPAHREQMRGFRKKTLEIGLEGNQFVGARLMRRK